MNCKDYVFTDSDLDGVGSLLVIKWLLGKETLFKTTTHKHFREDFVNFFTSYTQRRDIDIVKTIDNEGFTKWWEEMNAERT